MENTTKTLEYYNHNFQKFTADTVDVEFTDIQDFFLKYLSEGDLILDFGCGAGRDSRSFLKRGFRVEASDGSAEMVKIAEKTAGIPVRQMLFQELDETEKYDGIFACASILHVPYAELPSIFERMHKALKKGGIAYISFKYGTFEGERNGRYFTDLNEERLNHILEQAPGFRIEEVKITGDVRPGRDEEKWLNAIIRKQQ